MYGLRVDWVTHRSFMERNCEISPQEARSQNSEPLCSPNVQISVKTHNYLIRQERERPKRVVEGQIGMTAGQDSPR